MAENINIVDYAEKAYLTYAMMTVKDRALPQVQDGQKPVQKRILYAMWEDHLDKSAKFVKSAKVVGTVLGNYHPHGDQACYSTLVRMAQPFSLRYPLIEGQGNFGSLDGDPPAAQRYTECRLSRYADLLLAEVHLGTVPFIPNYDGEKTEPLVLPARLPFVLLNGSSGIAVGMKCDIPSHNLTEIGQACEALMLNPKLPEAELLNLIPGPDFANGGQIISSSTDIQTIYKNGKGTLRVRAVFTIESLAKNQWQLVFSELPPDCSTKKILQELDSLVNPQPKKAGGKLTQEQINLKQLALSLIDTAKDNSDKSTPVRLIVEPKSSKINKEDLLAFLFARTSLESTVSLDFTVVGLDGKPITKNLPAILAEWSAFRLTSVINRLKHRLSQIVTRLHILEGRVIVLLSVEEVIETIRSSDNPKSDLITKFNLSEIQAEDILEIKLRQLARLEGFKLEQEIKQLTTEKEKIEKLLANEKALRKEIAKEINSDVAIYGDARRTLIKEEVATIRQTPAIQASDDPISVHFTKNGLIKARSGHALETPSLKTGDEILIYLEMRTLNTVVLLSNLGRCYSLDGHTIPTKGDGVPITSLIDLQQGERILFGILPKQGLKLLLAGSFGYGFIVKSETLISKQKAGKAVITLNPGEIPLNPCILPEQLEHGKVIISGTAGKLLIFDASEINEIEKGKGVKLISLEKDEQINCLSVLTTPLLSPLTVTVQAKAGELKQIKLTDLTKFYLHRSRKGSYIDAKKSLITQIHPHPIGGMNE